MATVTVKDGFALLIAFDSDAQIIEVQYADGDRYEGPIGSYDTSPLTDVVTVHKIEELSIMIYEKADQTIVMCPHFKCNRWC